MLRANIAWPPLLLAAAIGQAPAAAQTERFEIGFRGLILLGKGNPANDMVGAGIVGRFEVNDRWLLGLALDNVKFDYETPNRTLGIAAATVVDGLNEWRRVSVFAERRYDGPRTWGWHWLAGVGSAAVDDVGNVSGQRAGGGSFDIETTADDELHFFAGAGLHRTLARRWLLETSLTIEQHGTDYQLMDRVSGARGIVGSHSVYGIAIGINYSF
jgi:hypothetical protein